MMNTKFIGFIATLALVLFSVPAAFAANIPPTAVPDPNFPGDPVFSVKEDNTLNLAVGSSILSNDIDPDGDNRQLTAVIAALPSHGAIYDMEGGAPGAIHETGIFSYKPDDNWFGTETFTYKAVDLLGGISDEATVTITVTSEEDAPFAETDTYSFDEGAFDGGNPFSVDAEHGLLANDYDNDVGDESWLVEIYDNSMPFPNLLGAPINPPFFGVPIALNHGFLVVLSDGSFEYTPFSGDEWGPELFQYLLKDKVKNDPSNYGSVLITINPVNDAPVAQSALYNPLNNGIITEEVLFKADGHADHAKLYMEDVDGNQLTITVTDPEHGMVGDCDPNPIVPSPVGNQNKAASDGTFCYLSDPDYFGQDSFTYTLNDKTVNSDTVDVLLIVTNNPDDPVAVMDTYACNILAGEDTCGILVEADAGVLSNDTDADGADDYPLVVDPDVVDPNVFPAPAQGAVLWTVADDNSLNGAFSYFSFPIQAGVFQDVFGYAALDQGGASSGLTLVIINFNHQPVVNNDEYGTNEDTPLSISADQGIIQGDPINGRVGQDTDLDNDLLTAQLVTAPEHAIEFTLYSDGSFDYLPEQDWNGDDYFYYTVTDGYVVSAEGAVQLVVNAQNDAPVLAHPGNVTKNAGSAVSFKLVNATDADTGDTLIYTAVRYPSGGALPTGAMFNDTTLEFKWPSPPVGTYEINFTVTDLMGNTDNEIVKITINAVVPETNTGGGGGGGGGSAPNPKKKVVIPPETPAPAGGVYIPSGPAPAEPATEQEQTAENLDTNIGPTGFAVLFSTISSPLGIAVSAGVVATTLGVFFKKSVLSAAKKVVSFFKSWVK